MMKPSNIDLKEFISTDDFENQKLDILRRTRNNLAEKINEIDEKINVMEKKKKN